MALKGTTKIQLFDAETGELTDEIVKENMVTNAVPNILNPAIQMLLGANPNDYTSVTSNLPGFLKRCSPIGRNLFGGVLIFSEGLEEDVNNIIPSPRDRNNILGYAGQYSGVSGNLMKGSYNQVESVELDNGFTHVWEFTTEQANGDIACVALTSAMGGDCGWNTPHNSTRKGNFLIPIVSTEFTRENKLYTDSDGSWNSSTAIAFLNAKFKSDNTSPYYNEIVTNGESTALFGVGYNSDSGQVFVRWSVSDMACNINLNQIITTNAFENAPNVVSEGRWERTGDNSRGSVDYFRGIAVDNVYRLWHQDYDTDTSISSKVNVVFTIVDFILNDDGTVTVKDPVSFTVSGDNLVTVAQSELGYTENYVPYHWTPKHSFIEGNYIYLQGIRSNATRDLSDYFIRIAMNNVTDITFLEKPDGLKDNLVVSRAFGEWLLYYDASYGSDAYCYRTADCITYARLDSGWQLAGLSQKNIGCISEPYVCLEYSRVERYNTDEKTARVMLLAPYLATINNLDTVVTKTSSKTMKITYTIQNT